MPTIAGEVRKEILGKIKSGESVKKLASQYGICDRTIYAWLRKGVTESISALEFGRLKKENQVLKEIVGALTIELEKLKKKTGVR